MKIIEMLVVAAVASVILVSVIEAHPQSEGELIVLWNGEDHVRVTAGDVDDSRPHSHQLTAESFSCKGSSRCGSLNPSQCDAAKRTIQTNNRYFTGGSAGSTGVCNGNCGLFVSGSNCDLFGYEMNTAYDQLRNNNCRICGIKTFDDGCQFKIDFVTGC